MDPTIYPWTMAGFPKKYTEVYAKSMCAASNLFLVKARVVVPGNPPKTQALSRPEPQGWLDEIR